MSSGFPDFRAFPGCPPGAVTSQYMPYSAPSSFSSTFVEWFFPWAVTISQFIACNFSSSQYGIHESDRGSSFQFYVANQLKASRIWNATDRVDDRGTVWDLNLLIPSETPCRIIAQQWRTCNNTINNNCLGYLTGYHLRDY